MRGMKCPVCGGEVPRTVLRSKTFPCPICKEPLLVRDWSPLLTVAVTACGYWLTFVIAERLGPKGNGLFVATLFLGTAGGLVAASVLGLLWGWLFPVPLERAPGPGSHDGGILHIDSAPGPRNRPS